MRIPRRRIVAVTESALASLSDDDAIRLPGFDLAPYLIAVKPEGARLRGWKKLEETERRLMMLRWVIAVTDNSQPQHHTLIDDCETAFLLAFEATLQLLKQELVDTGRPGFEAMVRSVLSGKGDADIIFRGIRTLRNLEAHVEAELTTAKIYLNLTGESQHRVTRQWQFRPLTAAILKSLHTKHITDPGELDRWNVIVQATSVDEVMETGLRELALVVTEGEVQITYPIQ